VITKKGIVLVVSILTSIILSMAFQDVWAEGVNLNPSYAQRNVGGKVRMHIQMTGATELLSMGIKVTFPPELLQVISASKNKSVWRFAELEPDPLAYSPEIEIDNTNGVVKMIGGRLAPGVSGNILLGWIIFQCSSTNTGSASVSVSLANPSPYNNFVKQDGTVSDGSITFAGANICIVSANACEGDFDGNGYVTGIDYGRFRNAYGSSFPSDKYDPAADFDANGYITGIDYGVFRADYGRTNCPKCF